MFSDCEIISRYTRAQAKEDGCLIDISARFPECSRLYKYNVAITASVWGILEKSVNHPSHCNDFAGVVWDLLFMSINGKTRIIDPTEHLFQVIITGTGRNRYHTFKAMCGPGDEGEPVITIMGEDED